VIAETARWVVVMYAGQVVESGSTLDIFENPLHPYTRGLLRSVPSVGRRAKFGRERLKEIPGMVPSLYDLPPGCAFNPRCPDVMDVCRRYRPKMTERGDTHSACCWLLDERADP